MSSALDKRWEELRVGDEVISGGRTITEADVVAFGTLTGDLHPLHMDREWAAGSAFGERIAQGLLLLAYSFGLVPMSTQHVFALRRLKDVTFSRPVSIGDTIRVRCRVRELKSIDDDLGLVATAWEVLNQSNQPTLRAAVELLWRRA